MRHPRRDVKAWRNLFDQQEQSGLSAVEFCRQQQINIQTFYARRSDIRLQRTNSKFVHVKHEVTRIESRAENANREFTLKHGGSQLSLAGSICPRWMASLMKALNE